MAYKPPRDHAESIRMLKAEEERVSAAEDRRGMFWAICGLVSILALAAIVASVVFGLFGTSH